VICSFTSSSIDIIDPIIFQDPVDQNIVHVGFESKPVTAIPRIRAALSFMKKDMFEV